MKRFVRTIKAQHSRLAYVRFETEPGQQAQFDWGDFQIQEPGGRTSRVFVFMLVLGFSRADYVEFMDRCTLELLIEGHILGFQYLGGVQREILSDNMKHVVLGRDAAGQPLFNFEFLHFTRHYGFQPKACAPYSPWIKGKVERPIDFLRERFRRDYLYSFVQQANRDVLLWLNEMAYR